MKITEYAMERSDDVLVVRRTMVWFYGTLISGLLMAAVMGSWIVPDLFSPSAAGDRQFFDGLFLCFWRFLCINRHFRADA